MRKPHTSRRVPGLKDSDYDHEIVLEDNEQNPQSAVHESPETTELIRTSTSSALLPGPEPSSPRQAAVDGRVGGGDSHDTDLEVRDTRETRPSIEVQGPTPYDHTARHGNRKAPPADRETAIDVLMENERGGFLCGIALFSSKALGGLDPPPWTNAFRKPSPTSIDTAQVPDPTWEWAWPEWRIHREEGTDEGGWKYSFMFTRKSSWHGPKWYRSFVRRRIWIRKRVKKAPERLSLDPHMLNTDYFTVRPASEASHSRSASRAESHLGSGGSMISTDGEQLDIEDVETLLRVLRRSRIDREKIEAVENFVRHGGENLTNLRDRMHEIMSIFVFQNSRRLLLSNLSKILEDSSKELEAADGVQADALRRRREHLSAAIRQADEEVRTLAYWSDIKKMADGGVTADSPQGERQGQDENGNPLASTGRLP